MHVYLTHARDLMDLASPAQQGHGLEALLEREDPASALGRAFALLSPQEQYKALRFHRLNDGILYMASHAALRMLLSLEKAAVCRMSGFSPPAITVDPTLSPTPSATLIFPIPGHGPLLLSAATDAVEWMWSFKNIWRLAGPDPPGMP